MVDRLANLGSKLRVIVGGLWALGVVMLPHFVGAQESDPGQQNFAPPAGFVQDSLATADLSVLATRQQMLVILLAVIALAVYVAVRYVKYERRFKCLEAQWASPELGLHGAKYERLKWDELFRSAEEGLPILPGLSFDRPRLLVLGCPGAEEVPPRTEFARNPRVNLLLNCAFTVLSEPTQKLFVFSRRLGVRQIGWGLLSLAARTDFNKLSDTEKAEVWQQVDLDDWEESLYCFSGYSISFAELHRLLSNFAEKDLEFTLLLDGWDFLQSDKINEEECSTEELQELWQGLAQKLSVLAERGHAGIILLLNTDSQAWQQRGLWAENWAEVELTSEPKVRYKAQGQWTNYDGSRVAIEHCWEYDPESGALR